MSIESNNSKISYLDFYFIKNDMEQKINIKTKIDKTLSYYPLLSIIFIFLITNNISNEYLLIVFMGLLFITFLFGTITCYIPVYIAHRRLKKYIDILKNNKTFFEFSELRKFGMKIFINFLVIIILMIIILIFRFC